MTRFSSDMAPVVLIFIIGVAGGVGGLGLSGCERADDATSSGTPASDASGSATAAASDARPADPDAEARWTTGDTADGTWSIAWRPVGGIIPPLDPFSVEVVVRDPSGEAIPAEVGVLVDATMPHHGHGMNVEPRIARTGEADGGATFVADGMLLHMPGRWEFTVDVVRGDEVERAQWTVMLDD